MEELISKIKSLSRPELEAVMAAVEERYSAAYPDWDVVYVALHKDPVQRKREFEALLEFAAKDLQWNREQWENPPNSGAGKCT